MTKVGIVRSGTLRQRLSNHIGKAHYDKVRLLRVVTLDAATPDGRYQCDGIVTTTEKKVKRALSREGRLVPQIVPQKKGVCETEVVLRCDENRALSLIEEFTSTSATLNAALTHAR